MSSVAARESLSRLCELMLFRYSDTPQVGAVSLMVQDWDAKVVAALTTAVDASGEVDRYVTPFGDLPMTEREFLASIEMAVNAIIAFHRNVGDVRSADQANAIQALTNGLRLHDESIERAPRARAEGQLEMVAAMIGMPSQLRLEENAAGMLVAVAGEAVSPRSEPRQVSYPLGSGAYDVGQLALMLRFTENALYHHEAASRNRAMERIPVAPRITGMTYSGEVEPGDTDHFVLRDDADRRMRHRRESFSLVPAVGKRVTIKYAADRGDVFDPALDLDQALER